jgi:hypothetical protein
MSIAAMFVSSESDTEAPEAPEVPVMPKRRRCGKAVTDKRMAELEMAALRAKLAFERARRRRAETRAASTQCPLTMASGSQIDTPVVLGSFIVDATALAAHIAHHNPNVNPDNRASIRIPHPQYPNEHATLGWVAVVTKAQQAMHGVRPTPLGALDRSAADLLVRLLKRQLSNNQLGSESDSEFS